MSTGATADVVIASAGPYGVMPACELSLAGVRPVVLERLSLHTEEHRANGLIGQVVRQLDRRGPHDRLSGNPEPPSAAPRYVFGALPLELDGLDDNPMTVLPVPQRRIEQVLTEELAGAHDRVDTVTAHTDAAPATALLLRPDGYVAWASSAPRPDRAALHAAVGRWFGAAA